MNLSSLDFPTRFVLAIETNVTDLSNRRYFTPWKGARVVENFYLPRSITKIMGQKKVPIGDALISTLDTCVGVETCEELFVSARSSVLDVNDKYTEIHLDPKCSSHRDGLGWV